MIGPDQPVLLALLPSEGLGGGIEAYADAVLEAARAHSMDISTHALVNRGGGSLSQLMARASFTLGVRRTARALRSSSRSVEVLCFHPGLLPVGLFAARALRSGRVRLRVFVYGVDIWSASVCRRAIWKRAKAEFITISAFSAGALLGVRASAVLPPGIASRRYERLLSVRRSRHRPASPPLHVLSVFRLTELEAKGGWTLAAAIDRLRASGSRVTLTIAGQGEVGSTSDIARMSRYPWIKVAQNPSDEELAQLYEDADLFVLASRLRTPPNACGEGFGIVLAEAALAGLPIIAPAAGGSHAAFIDGLTGLAPVTQSSESLEELLDWATTHRAMLDRMGDNGRKWARNAFDPQRYAALVASVLFSSRPFGNLPLALSFCDTGWEK